MEPTGERPYMPGYGVEECETWRPLPWSWAAKQLSATRGYWLSTVSPNEIPHSMPVWGVWDDAHFRFFFSASADARKIRNLTSRPHATVTTESTSESVSVQGRVSVINPEHIDEPVGLYVSKYGEEVGAEILEPFIRQSPIFELIPECAFGMLETPEDFAARATKWRFTQP